MCSINIFQLLLRKTFPLILIVLATTNINSCKKIDGWNDENPDIEPLKQGFKTAAAIGYCVSLATTVLSGDALPDNVLLESSNSNSGLIYVTVDANNPLPFNNHIGDIIIAYLWENDQTGGSRNGVISIVFANLNIIGNLFKFYGIHTVPVIQDMETGKIMTVFARQDIVFGEGSDTLLNLSMSDPQFSSELLRLDQEPPVDPFVAVSQNVWFISIDQQNTVNLYDDSFVISGGGQIAEATNSTGGIQYHAMIETEFIYDHCTLNPIRGDAFIQNLKAGTSTIDLGNIYLSFHNRCDGKAYVNFASGEYLNYMGRNVNLQFN
jgi:hypothetical protein